jgi:hypothetical protein
LLLSLLIKDHDLSDILLLSGSRFRSLLTLPGSLVLEMLALLFGRFLPLGELNFLKNNLLLGLNLTSLNFLSSFLGFLSGVLSNFCLLGLHELLSLEFSACVFLLSNFKSSFVLSSCDCLLFFTHCILLMEILLLPLPFKCPLTLYPSLLFLLFTTSGQ